MLRQAVDEVLAEEASAGFDAQGWRGLIALVHDLVASDRTAAQLAFPSLLYDAYCL